jgi:hypothetical protein
MKLSLHAFLTSVMDGREDNFGVPPPEPREKSCKHPLKIWQGEGGLPVYWTYRDRIYDLNKILESDFKPLQLQ